VVLYEAEILEYLVMLFRNRDTVTKHDEVVVGAAFDPVTELAAD
jgi:hypothetical protein